MHAHIPLQEMNLLAAPLIVRSKKDAAADRQEVVMFLHDLSFKPPAEVMAEITGGTAGHGDHGAPAPAMGGMSHAMPEMDTMGSMQMDLNDYEWDAYLANDRTLADPDVIRVEAGGRVLLRVINGAAATVFWIDLEGLKGRLVAVDGHAVSPIAGGRFGLAMGQRLDIEIDLPSAGAFPIFALREGALERTGIILATPGSNIPMLSGVSEEKSPAFDVDLSQEAALTALVPLSLRAVERTHMVTLGGSMQPYLWTIDDRRWGNHKPIAARSGERVEIMFHNGSMMGHPMHLHGHTFQVVDVNGRRINGARRDTVYVPPMSMVTVALDAGEAARWMLHCHHMPHLETGMMTEFAVEKA
jgi:FtsP/CotA-like multicopper oxidase with cupredoxin domain